MSSRDHRCAECDNPISGRTKQFCSTKCRMAFNNRRMQRGAEIYDLFRALRLERDQAKALGLWSEICRLEFVWQQEDDRERPGRRSYVPPKKALAHLADKGSLPRGKVMWTNI